MILTDDNFATIVKAVELGRGLYDNLVKYIRFQMGVLAGMIVTFLGASILNIASGIPFLPLQTLWVNFTTQVFQSVGLGYGEPSEGLMERRPRKPEQPILTRADTRWFVVAGLVMAVATLAVIAGRRARPTARTLARTMGLTTFAIANLFFSFTARDELRSVFSLDTFSDRTFLITSLMSAAAIIFATELRVLPAHPRHRRADRQPVADLHRRGPADRRGLGDPQVRAAPARLSRRVTERSARAIRQHAAVAAAGGGDVRARRRHVADERVDLGGGQGSRHDGQRGAERDRARGPGLRRVHPDQQQDRRPVRTQAGVRAGSAGRTRSARWR